MLQKKPAIVKWQASLAWIHCPSVRQEAKGSRSKAGEA